MKQEEYLANIEGHVVKIRDFEINIIEVLLVLLLLGIIISELVL